MKYLLTSGYIDITPTAPLPLAGWGGQGEISSEIADILEVNVLVLRQAEKPFVFVSVDSLFTGQAFFDFLMSEFPELAVDRLWLAASHTHFAPALDDSKPLLGKANSAWCDVVYKRTAQLIRRLLDQDGVETELRYHIGRSQNAINRRRRGWQLSRKHILRKQTIGAPNPAGVCDDSIHALSFYAGDSVQAVLWSSACHPVASPNRNAVSSDYPGWVRRSLRRKYHSSMPVVFLQGFCGNLRPNATQSRIQAIFSKRKLAQRLNSLINGSTFADMTSNQYARWAISYSNAVAQTLDSDGEIIVGEISSAISQIPAEQIHPGSHNDEILSIRKILFGEALCFVGLSAEPAAEYAKLIKKLIGKNVVTVGYLDQVFGYLPTDEMVQNGGYEVDGFAPWFGLSGKFIPELEGHVLNAVRNVGQQSNIH